MIQDDDLLQEFVVESSEHLADVESQLLEIESCGAEIDLDLVNTVFRAVHSVKGAAGFLGLSTINELAHNLENVLNQIRNQELVPTGDIVDVLLRSADVLRNLVGDVDGSNDVDVSEPIEELKDIYEGKLASADEQEVVDSVADVAATATEAADSIELDDLPTEQANANAEKAEIQAPAAEVAAATPPPAPAPSPAPAKQPVQQAAQAGQESKKAAKQADSYIRVNIAILDQLMNLAGELVLGRNQLIQSLTNSSQDQLEAVAARLDHVTSELQEAIMQTRMQQIGTVFTKFTRVVRDLSNKLGKSCTLHIEGEDVELDKTIIEAIGDPLTHLVRNSIDHGVESPSEREAAGKPGNGTLHLRAYHQSGKVCIEIEDDGKGINADILRAKAVTKGILTQEQADAMGDREAVRLIFHPGFSTAQQVTDVSGRGVGMDVVRSNIERLGGTVDVETKVGEGTTIVVMLPLTLAIIPSLIVESSSERFAIPQVNISELVRIRNDELETRIGRIKDKEVLRLRGSLLPLVSLRDALGEAAKDESERGRVRNIIVVESGPLRYGVVVDELFDSEEIVVKPFGRHLKDSPCLSGATILGDGCVALILDVAGIAGQMNLKAAQDEETRGDEDSDLNGSQTEMQSVLLFTNDPSEQFAIPMELVSRIERITSDQIDTVGGQDLLQYAGGSLPLLSLEKVINAKERPEQERLFAVVCEAGGREVGLLAPNLVDIRDVPADFDTTTLKEVGVMGSKVIDGSTTRLLETVALARSARPDWFVDRPTFSNDATPSVTATTIDQPNRIANYEMSGTPESLKSRVLLAEDSSFFRKQVKGFLVSAGCDVVDCEDGREAWTTLAASPDQFDLVLTDIEMPNMDGLELTRKIRSENQFAELPIVALTSLSSKEDHERGYDAGVTEYHVKLDRDELIGAIQRLSIETANQNPVGA